MKRKVGVLLLLLFSFLATSFLAVSILRCGAEISYEQLAITNDMGYVDSFGKYHVLGEIENRGDDAVEEWELNATFYGNNGDLLLRKSFRATNASAALTTINPGKKSPFEIVIDEEGLAAEVNHYIVAVASLKVAFAKPMGLEIQNSSYYKDFFGNIIVTGTVKNIGSLTAGSTKVVATFYDANGRVIAVEFSYEQGSRLAPGESASFQIELASTDLAVVKSVSGFALEAESDEYSSIPEFPMFAVSLFFLAVSVMVLVSKRQGWVKHLRLLVQKR